MILDEAFPSCHVVRIIVQIRAQYADFDNPHNPESIDARALPEPTPRISRPYPWVITPCGWRKFGGSGFSVLKSIRFGVMSNRVVMRVSATEAHEFLNWRHRFQLHLLP
jgi:hypothetical protein